MKCLDRAKGIKPKPAYSLQTKAARIEIRLKKREKKVIHKI